MNTQDTAGPWSRYGWLVAVVWLAFLYFPGVALTRSEAAEPLLVLGWIGLTMFALAYTVGFILGMRTGWRSPTVSVRVLFFLAVFCAAVTIPAIGWDCTSFLPFLMAYASYGLGNVWHWVVMAVSICLVTFEMVLSATQGTTIPWVLLGVVVMMAVVNTINTWLIDRSVASDGLRIELATSEERESVARDVHDLIGHTLTVVKLKAELASRIIDRDPQSVKTELDEIVRLTGEAIAGVRETVTGIRGGGFAEQIRVSRDALESVGITVDVMGEPQNLSPAQSIPAGWIVREATTNILRHAHAKHVRVSIEPGTVIIEDDGIGVRTEPGNGIRGMEERAAAAGAVLQIASGVSPGTRVSVTW